MRRARDPETKLALLGLKIRDFVHNVLRTTAFSLDLAGRVLEREISQSDHERLIKHAAEDFVKFDASNN